MIMQTFTLPPHDPDMLDDLMEEISELYQSSEATLIELESQPTDVELQRSLFRAVHTIKGDLGLVNFEPIIPLVSHVEDLLDYLRNGKIEYTSIMSDLVLLTMDRVEQFVEQVIQQGEIEFDDELYSQLEAQINKIKPENKSAHSELLSNAVILLDPSLKMNGQNTPSAEPAQLALTIEDELKDDLEFFRQVMLPIERRSRYWNGRAERIAKLCLYVNEVAGTVIPEEQLIAACYVHDFGMAFVSHELLHKQEPLTKEERQVLHEHIDGSARLLKHLPNWQEALKIVVQHHERSDGSGYPLGLREHEICDGAKLLALADSYEALTHERAHISHVKRPMRRAITELNADADKLFSPVWMEHFNKAMLNLMRKTDLH